MATSAPGGPPEAGHRDPAAVTVSVAMCTHNGARFVAEQLVSILTQQPPPDQLVVSDDASTDGTLEVVRATFAAQAQEGPAGRAPELIVLENPVALGVVANFEQALSACTGDLIALSDQDDVWLPGRLRVAVERFAADPNLLLLHSDARLVDADGAPLGVTLFRSLDATRRELGRIESGRALDTLIRRNLVTGATTMVRRELVDAARPFPPEWVHDEWLAIVAATLGGVSLVREPLIDYRQHGGNAIGARRLGLREKAGRLSESRAERNARLLRRSEVFVEWVQTHTSRVDVLRAAEGRLAHEQMRSALPPGRLRRLPRVLGAFLRGRYHRYGRGLMDVARDLLQPA